ncbi:MAG: acetaldehyde dehydrogenase (acetylating) [Deltaproteobacteria bacterium]|nr:acetaldehyde dehydrogenase (acetylating) [Deltaproteobacteria bacterium]
MRRATAAIVGSGNIGTDLLYKLMRSDCIEPRWLVGIDPHSEGLRRAQELGVEASSDGVDWLLARPEPPQLVFEATSAAVHRAHAPRYEAAGIVAVDLTPAAIGPYVVPAVNLDDRKGESNLNLITCGGQATVPMVHAVARVAPVRYAEIVASVSSASAGPGTRANIDEFTRTTAEALEVIGGAERGKAIIVLNPADPPLIMRDSIFCSLSESADREAVAASIHDVLRRVQEYVPGYRLTAEPQFTEDRVEIFCEVEGAGDFLPPYAGNLDIMTAAAARVGERVARARLGAG